MRLFLAAFAFFFKACIFGCHEFLKFILFFLCDSRLHLVVVIVLEEHWEHLLRGVAFRTTECVGAGEDVLCDELIQEMVTLAVSSDDATGFPELDIIEELTTRDSYLANEQLVEVVGG